MFATFAILIAGIGFSIEQSNAEDCFEYASRMTDRFIEDRLNQGEELDMLALTDVMNYFYAVCSIENPNTISQ